MQVKDLQAVIEQIQLVFEDAGAKSAASDFAELQTLFEGCEDQSVDAFIADLRRLYVKAPAKTPQGAVNEVVVKRHTKALAEAGEDKSTFEAAVKALDADKAVRKSEMNAIQKAYIGGRDAWPTRKAALDAITDTFARRAYQREAMKGIEKVTPW